MALFNRSSENIQITSHPDEIFMPQVKGSKKIKDWCLSHLPGWGCYVSHFCANSYSKQVLRNQYIPDYLIR